MNRRSKQARNRKRSSANDNEIAETEPPPKIVRKSPGLDGVQAFPQGGVAVKDGSVALKQAPMTVPSAANLSDGSESIEVVSTPTKMMKNPASVTPPKSPPRVYNNATSPDEVVVERMELDEEYVGRLKDRDLFARSGCQMDSTVEGGQAIITFRGTRKSVDTAKAMVAVICSQESFAATESSKIESLRRSTMGVLASALTSVNDFFHARTGPEACVLGGWMRIAYAFLFIMDRLLWSVDLDYFFYQRGVLPTRMTHSYSYIEPDTHVTIFQLAPESDWLVWTVNYLCLLQGILLLLGIAPRLQIACLVVYLASWEHQNDHAWDSQDVMLRMFGFLLCFMPLHRLTIYEWINTRGMTKKEKHELYKNDSWPMWPFRLWQIEICFIYAGAGLSKLANEAWQNGLAVYYATFSNHFGGVFTPGFLFDRIGPLKLMCYGSLFVECVAWVSVWPLCTRMPSLVAIVLLHVGIDLSMNMNIFEWLSCLGWMPFLVRPSGEQEEGTLLKSNGGPSRHSRAAPSQKRRRHTIGWMSFLAKRQTDKGEVGGKHDEGAESNAEATAKPSGSAKLRRLIVNTFITLFVVIYASETIPIHHIKRMTPSALKPIVSTLKDAFEEVGEVAYPWLHRLGIHQQTWSMFSNPVNKSERYKAYVTFKDETKTTWWSPDWNEMSWLEKKRNRRRQLYFNNLMEFKNEDTVGQKRLCEWIAEQYEKPVERVKLVYHWTGALPPSKDLSWFDEIDRENVDTKKKTHYIHYTQEACDEWALDGDCLGDAAFMLKRCADSCKGTYDDASDIEVGSRVLVFYEKDNAFYTASVLEIRQKKPKRFFLKWDFEFFGKEWYDLDKNAFSFVGENKFISSHKSKRAPPSQEKANQFNGREL